MVSIIGMIAERVNYSPSTQTKPTLLNSSSSRAYEMDNNCAPRSFCRFFNWLLLQTSCFLESCYFLVGVPRCVSPSKRLNV